MPLAARVPVHPSAAEPPIAKQVAPAANAQVNVTGLPVITVVALALIESLSGDELESGTMMGTPPLTSVRPPVGLPATVGVYATVTVHAAVDASDAPQLFVWILNWLEMEAPPKTMDVAPTLVKVTVCGALVVPIAWLEKVKGPGATWSNATCRR